MIALPHVIRMNLFSQYNETKYWLCENGAPYIGLKRGNEATIHVVGLPEEQDILIGETRDGEQFEFELPEDCYDSMDRYGSYIPPVLEECEDHHLGNLAIACQREIGVVLPIDELDQLRQLERDLRAECGNYRGKSKHY